MKYQGEAFSIIPIQNGFFQLQFDLQNESVNKFNQLAIQDLSKAIEVIKQDKTIKGIVLTSAKENFVVGADITEFTAMFSQTEEVLTDMITQVNHIFNSLEDLPIPIIAAVNGLALGGGFEYCLCADYRVAAKGIKVGLPEVKLGIYPGWGGTVRLPRLIGADNAIEWICTGQENTAEKALAVGAIDSVVETKHLLNSAVKLLEQCVNGTLDFQARKIEKQTKIKLDTIESMMVFETAKPYIASKAGKHYPAPLEAVKVIQKHANLKRDKALAIETKGFVKLARNQVTQALVGLFLNDQYLKKQAKNSILAAQEVKKVAVLGAGIMGGGIAYQSASKGIPVIMKDVAQQGLDAGLAEARQLLKKQLERGKIDINQLSMTLNSIQPALTYGEFNEVDVVVEAVVENSLVKEKVLQEVETKVPDNTILATNTSTISIDILAKNLQRPEQFCGMHFFNPVHRMPLVEVIRGKQTSDKTIATVVNYAKKIGKTPIVVNDCPGFLVNRVLFPYFGAFAKLMKDGAQFEQIDRVMERFGWPMGPAWLLDVVGMDTAYHAEAVMAAGYPERMQKNFKTVVDWMFEQKRFGQKNGQGFYTYQLDKKGKVKKVIDPNVQIELLAVCEPSKVFEEEDIISRMMIPLCLETVRALEEGIVQTPQEADMALIFGIGFPPFIGGALKYIEQIGIDIFIEQTKKYQSLGALYQPTEKMLNMAKNKEVFYKK